MNQEQLFSFYEKLYFHELDRREKLSARLNIPLAIMVATIGLLSFMLNSATLKVGSATQLIFWALFVGSCIATAMGAWFFRSSWFGHTDKLLPTANSTEAYRNDLIALYSEYDEADQLVEGALKKYLYDYYKQFSSVNTVNNDSRAYHLYLATYAITVAVLLAFFALIPYFFAKQSLPNDNQTAAATSATTAPVARCKGARSESTAETPAPEVKLTTKR